MIVAYPPGGQPIIADFVLQDIIDLPSPQIDIGAQTAAAQAKTTPANADLFPLADSANGFGLKSFSWGNLASIVQGWFSAPSGSYLVGWLAKWSGAVPTTVQNKLQDIISVTDAGAIGSGLVDDAPAFRLAVTGIRALGGGDIFVPAGNYKLSTADTGTALSVNEYAIFNLPSNVAVKGTQGSNLILDGATLQASALFVSNANRFSFIGILSSAVGCNVSDLNFSTNGWVLTHAFSSINMVRCAGSNVVLRNLYGANIPGRNMIVTYPTSINVLIDSCTILNGGKNVAGNTVSDDCSFLYLQGSNQTVRNCTFTNAATATHNCGGVELHGNEMTVDSCYFKNLWPATYAGSVDNIVAAHDYKYVNNTFSYCGGGIVFGSPCTDVLIKGNSFKYMTTPVIGNYAISGGRNSSTGLSSGILKGLNITENYFEEGQYANPSIALAALQGSKITNNLFSGGSNSINVQLASDAPTDGLLISNNIQDSPYLTPATGTGLVIMGGDASPTYTWTGTYKNIFINGNTITSPTATNANQCLIAAAGNVSYTTITNVTYSGNSTHNIGATLILGTLAAYITPVNDGNFSTGIVETSGSITTLSATASSSLIGATNTNSATNAYAALRASVTGSYADIRTLGAGWTYRGWAAGTGVFYTTNTAGLILGSDSTGPVATWINGVQIAVVTTTGYSVTGKISCSSYFAANGATAVAPTAGYGTPDGNVIATNFPGATATLAQTSATLSQLLLDLKKAGLIAN
jgi:hypothetical protein